MNAEPSTGTLQPVLRLNTGLDQIDAAPQSSTSAPQRGIRLHIERLVLEGLPLEPHHGFAFQTALEFELARLFVQRGASPRLAEAAARTSLDGGRIQMQSETGPLNTTAQVARAVYGGLSQ